MGSDYITCNGCNENFLVPAGCEECTNCKEIWCPRCNDDGNVKHIIAYGKSYCSLCYTKPEPDPVARGVIIPDRLVDYINASQMLSLSAKQPLTKLVQERDAFGRAKYGQPLYSEDGRNGVEDARQELGDLMQYLFKCKIAGVDTTEVIQMIRAFLLRWDEE